MKKIIALTVICTVALLGCGKKDKEPVPVPITETSASIEEVTLNSTEIEVSITENSQYIECNEIERYIGLSKEEILNDLKQRGFYEQDNTVTNGIEDADGICFKFDNNDNLENIVLFDFEGTSEWSFFGITCDNTPEECRSKLEEIGGSYTGHNMMETFSSMGLQDKGIERVRYGLDSNIGYIDIDINYKFINYLKNSNYSVIEESINGILCPVFSSDESQDLFYELNEAIKDTVNENSDELSGKDVHYRIECQEINNISISFYTEEYYKPIVAFNYNLEKNEVITECPFADEKPDMWLVNPIKYTLIYNDGDEETTREEWR